MEQRPRGARLRTALSLGCIVLCASTATVRASLYEAEPGRPRSLLVMDPVDVGSEDPKPRIGDILRRIAARESGFEVMPRDTAARRMREASIDPDWVCKEFQCAFDAGGAIQVEFVLFGTVTWLDGIHAITLKLLHVPTAQVVWARAAQAFRRNSSGQYADLQAALELALADIQPSHLDLRKIPGAGLVAILDAGKSSAHSRALQERAVAHAYASRSYDVIAPGEMEELLQALDVQAPAFATNKEEILDLGRKIDVRYMLCMRLKHSEDEFRMQMALYDVEKGKTVREWPSRAVSDFGKLLKLEDRFFNTLDIPSLTEGPAVQRPSALKVWGRYASVVAAMGVGAGLGYLAYDAKENADGEFRRFRSARSQEEAAQARARVMAEDGDVKRYGLLSGLSVMLGFAVWAF